MSKAKENKILLVAIDDGYAQAKIYGEDENGKLHQNIVRSSIKSGKHIGGFAGGFVGAYQTEEGETFTVSDSIEGESTRFNDFHISSMNRALINHGLIASGYSGKKVNLVCGVPIEDYFKDGSVNTEFLERKKVNLMKKVKVLSDKYSSPEIESVEVFAQAAAAFIDFVLDDKLEYREDPTKNVAIIDIGGRTTDIAVIQNGQEIVHERSGTSNIGALDVYKALEKKIRKKFDNDDPISSKRLDRAVRENVIDLFGEDTNIKELVDEAIVDVEGQIIRNVQGKIGSGSDLSSIVFVGGGSNIFKELHKRFPKNGKVSENPEYSNVKGLYKYRKAIELGII